MSNGARFMPEQANGRRPLPAVHRDPCAAQHAPPTCPEAILRSNIESEDDPPWPFAFEEPPTELRAVRTVERFQGGERTLIPVSATESDRAYLLASCEFLLDPCRLTVALSRAKRKMILVASRSI